LRLKNDEAYRLYKITRPQFSPFNFQFSTFRKNTAFYNNENGILSAKKGLFSFFDKREKIVHSNEACGKNG